MNVNNERKFLEFSVRIMNENYECCIMNETKVIFYCPLTTIIMAVDPLDNSSERFISITIIEIKILVSFMNKIKSLFPEEGHYYIHKACNILLIIFKEQLAPEDVKDIRSKGEFYEL